MSADSNHPSGLSFPLLSDSMSASCASKSAVQKNKKTVFEIIVPKNEEKYAGQKEKIEVLVTKIQYKNEQRLTNEYVRKNFEGLNNIHDYYRYVKQTIADEKNLEQQNKIKNNIKKQLATIYNVKIKEEQKALYAKKYMVSIVKWQNPWELPWRSFLIKFMANRKNNLQINATKKRLMI